MGEPPHPGLRLVPGTGSGRRWLARRPLRAPAARALAFAVAATCVAGLFLGAPLVAVWIAAALLLSVLAAREARVDPGPAGTPAAARDLALVGLGLLCAAVALFAHRADADDAFLLNLAVSAADHPEAAILAADTLHGLPGPPAGVPAGLPLYRFHSIELLEGALAWLTRLRVIDVAHLAVPAVAAFGVPFVYARLFRLLVPGRWLLCVACALGYLLCVGDTHLGYGNLAFVRLHQGKAILLTAGVPLLIATALELGLDPGRARWIRLAVLQIACVGLSATALWLAPAVAGLALLGAVPWRTSGVRTLVIGATASLYPLAVGAALLVDTRSALGALAYRLDHQALPEYALDTVLGGGPAASMAVLAGWSLAPSALGRRLAVLFPLAFFALLWNPWIAAWIADHVIGEPTYWRIFWALPVPVFVGIALSAPLGPPPLAGSRRLAAGLCVVGTALLLAFAPTQQTLSPRNRVRLDTPGPKVPPASYAAARAVAGLLEPGDVVLAPHRVSTWLPTLHGHPFPLAARTEYVLSLSGVLGEAEARRRVTLTRLVSGAAGGPRALELLERALSDGSLDAVCLAPEATAPDLRDALVRSGWRLAERVGSHEIWMPSRANTSD